MFVLLFVYVFGGAIQTPGFDYVDFLMPGIIVQSMAFGGFVTALGLVDDLKKGLIDRFRSLPMSAPGGLSPAGCSPTSGTNVLQLVIMLTVGLARRLPLLDERRREVVAGIVARAALRLRVLLGLRLHRAHRVVAGGSERVRLHDPLPAHVRLVGVRPRRVDADWLQPFAEHNPFTTMVDAARALFVGTPAGNDVWLAFVWALGIIAVFAPLSIWRYRRAVTR